MHIATTGDLQTRDTKSCGCFKLDNQKSIGGLSKNIAYDCWRSVIMRTTNPKCKDYARYGAAGIGVWSEWLYSFESFLRDIGPRPSKKHTVDRIDNAKGYEPGNVRWATSIEQSANRHNTAMVEYQGVVQPLALLARAHGLNPVLVHKRVITRGWSVEKALGLST
jgi:hypothetical protein